MTGKTNFTIVKARWLDQLSCDPRISLMAFRVAGIIARHLNSRTGETFVGRERIAQGIPGRNGGTADIKAVQRAVAALEAQGYLAVIRPRGRGNSNVMTMLFPEIQDVEKGSPESGFIGENETPESRFDVEENGTSATVKRDFNSPKTGLQGAPNLIEPIRTYGGGAKTSIRSAAASLAWQDNSPEAIASQNRYGQAELRSLVELIASVLTIDAESAWTLLIESGEAKTNDLRRRMRRGSLDPVELLAIRQQLDSR